MGRLKKVKKRCRICGKTLARGNVTGLCGEHYKGGFRTPRKNRTVYARCWNKQCGKRFVLQKDQHPKYSLCPVCKLRRERIKSSSAVQEGHLR